MPYTSIPEAAVTPEPTARQAAGDAQEPRRPVAAAPGGVRRLPACLPAWAACCLLAIVCSASTAPHVLWCTVPHSSCEGVQGMQASSRAAAWLTSIHLASTSPALPAGQRTRGVGSGEAHTGMRLHIKKNMHLEICVADSAAHPERRASCAAVTPFMGLAARLAAGSTQHISD